MNFSKKNHSLSAFGVEFQKSNRSFASKNIIVTFVLFILTFTVVNAQIKKPVLKKTNVKVHKVNFGVKIKNIDKLSVAQLSKTNIPLVHTITEKLDAKPLSTWSIEPLRPKNNWLVVSGFHGSSNKDYWGVESTPFFEGSRIAHWDPGYLSLIFRQSKGTEYRLKIKIMGSNHRGKALYVRVDEMSGRYPINPDGTVNVVWRASYSSAHAKINIGHLLQTNFKSSDYRFGFPRTYIEKVTIDKIETTNH